MRDYESEFEAWQARRSAVIDASYKYAAEVEPAWDSRGESRVHYRNRKAAAQGEFLRAFVVALMSHVTDDAVERGLSDAHGYLPKHRYGKGESGV